MVKNFPDVDKPLIKFVFISDGVNIFTLTDDPNICLDVFKSPGQFVFSIALTGIITETQNTIVRMEKAEEATGNIFEVEMEPEYDGRWHIWCPILRGCHTWGHTQSEAMQYIEEAVNLYVDALIEDGKPIPGVGKVTKIKPIIRLKEKIEEEKVA